MGESSFAEMDAKKQASGGGGGGGSKLIDKTEKVYVPEEILRSKALTTDMNYRHTYLWQRVMVHVMIQLAGLIGLYTAIYHAKSATVKWAVGIGLLISQGSSVAAHRGFSHKSFKMSPGLKLLLMTLQTMTGQNSLYTWIRDHRLHHMYSDTDADPHNSSRGFFFSHVGWLLVERHPLLLEKQRQVDVSDLRADKMIMFQYRYFLQLYFPLAVMLPVSVPVFFWNESLLVSFLVVYSLQYAVSLHAVWCINSVAHLWGSKSYDKRIQAKQSMFTWLITLGEGWHNYHHAFPWDYRLDNGSSLIPGISTITINLMYYLGMAYDLKTASPDLVKRHMKRYGDGTWERILGQSEKLQKSVIREVYERLDHDSYMK